MLYLVTNNYVNQYGDSNKIVRALRSLEFMVTQEQVMSATARYADVILPANTFLERNDVTTGAVAPFYGYQNQVVAPAGESKSHLEIVLALAHRLGITEFDEMTEDGWLRCLVAENRDIADYEAFRRAGIHKLTLSAPVVAFEQQIRDPDHYPFPTPSGKIEIFSQDLADLEDPQIPPIPQYHEPREGINDPLVGKYPLQLLTPHTKFRAHSQFDGLPWLRELYTNEVTLSTADAAVRDIRDGDIVRIFNDRGEIVVPARVTERIMSGVVSVAEGAWYDPDEDGIDRGGCANVLTGDFTSPGGAFCSSSALVQVVKSGAA
jgi:anaerobic dimethyl sulfoxide reductase subunit A